MNLYKRVVSIDLLRAFAIITVVLCHSTENIYTMNQSFLSQISVQSRLFAIASFSVGRLGVPIFIFITGYLFLKRKYDDASCLIFWKKNWIGLLITTEIWIILYHIFFAIFYNQPFNTKLMLENMLFLKQVPLSHMWYMPMIIGLYIFIPFVANAVQKFSVNVLKWPIMFAGGYYLYLIR